MGAPVTWPEVAVGAGVIVAVPAVLFLVLWARNGFRGLPEGR